MSGPRDPTEDRASSPSAVPRPTSMALELALDRVDLVRAMTRAVRSRDAVVDVVAHDLATPLNAIELLLDRIEGACGGAEPGGTRYIDAIRRSVLQMRRLVDDLVDVRAIEQGLFSTQLSPQRVCDVIAAAVEQVEPTASERGVKLHVEESGCPIRVMADPGRVVQLVVNLLTNAIRVSAAGDTVTIHPRQKGEKVYVSVTDHGPGIPPEWIPHLFDRFSGGSAHGRHGRGLGLMIAHEIARLHQGEITLETEVGRGTTFTVSLQVAP